jgi:beta-galactosidase
LNLWRAPTDNDGFKFKPTDPEKLLGQWLAVGLDRLQASLSEFSLSHPAPHHAELRTTHHFTAAETDTAIDLQSTWQIFSDGRLILHSHLRTKFGLLVESLPRVGWVMALSPGFEGLTWYGRGPHESYLDRKRGAALGRYRSTVGQQYVPYVMPQENGNKTDVRWLSLSHPAGVSVLAVGQPTLEFTAHHFTAADFYSAWHTAELTPRPETWLTLDMAQVGLGGASCGPATRPAYRLPPGEYRFSVALTAFTTAQTNFAEVARGMRRQSF